MAQQGPNPIELYEAAVQAFRATLGGVRADQMQGSTPCTDWNVQALITHNIRVAAFVEGLLQENITVNPLDVSGGIPGDDPLKALDDNIAKVMDIIKASGSPDVQINTPFGEMTRGQFMMTPTWDLVIHKWDLAKGTGQSTTLDNSLVEAVYNTFAPMADGMRQMEMAGEHIVGPEVTVSAGASLQDRLLGAFGRQP